MDKMNMTCLFKAIYLRYRNSVPIRTGDGFYSYIVARKVVVPKDSFINADDWDVFALLHEIGHIMTNEPTQKRCVQEYLATQWAINESKNIGFNVRKSYIDHYQNYIWEWRDVAIKHKAKNIPTKNELILVV